MKLNIFNLNTNPETPIQDDEQDMIQAMIDNSGYVVLPAGFEMPTVSAGPKIL